MPPKEPEYVVAWPTLWVVPDWIEAHCIVPDRHQKGQPFEQYDWQLWCTVNHYRVKPTARVGQLSTAFHSRRSQIVGPQKSGKGPWSAAIISAEAVGPVLFAGWAEGGEVYDCRTYSCGCGWTYEYEPGEPMGRPWDTPLIQLLANSVDQVDNVYKPLQVMARNGPLAERMRVGEEWIRLPNDGEIVVVTSSARARLGNPVNFAMQDETGTYTKANKMVDVAETQRRGAAGMGGRSMETTNAWDPAEQSTAQRTAASRRPDIFRFHRRPPAHLSYGDRRDRRKIHRHVYAGSAHVDLDAIEAEAAELAEVDLAQAERFYGNRVVAGLGAWLKTGLWESRKVARPLPPDRTEICLGFDGSEVDDWTAIRAETHDGWGFTPTYGPDKRPTIWDPAEWGGSIPRGEVHAAVDELCRRWRVRRAYCDPRDWQSEIGDWALRHGEKVFVQFATYRVVQTHDALTRVVTDLTSGRATHDGCAITEEHVANARKAAKPGSRYLLQKASPQQKIDAAMADVLAHEAAAAERAAGWNPHRSGVIYTASSTRR